MLTAHDVDGTSDGTLMGNAEGYDDPIRGGCVSFPNSSGGVVEGDNSSVGLVTGNQLTLSCWIFPTAFGDVFSTLISKYNGPGGYRFLLRDTQKLRLQLRKPGGGNDYVDSSATVPMNQWTHVAARFDGNEMRLFINGVMDEAVFSRTDAIPSTGAQLRVGRYSSSTYRFQGYIDEVSVYDRALSTHEIGSLGRGWENRPIAYWPVNEGNSSPDVYDIDGGNIATLKNGVAWVTVIEPVRSTLMVSMVTSKSIARPIWMSQAMKSPSRVGLTPHRIHPSVMLWLHW